MCLEGDFKCQVSGVCKCATNFEVKLSSSRLMRRLFPSDAPDALDLRRHHHAGTDREETHPLHGDPLQTAPAPTEISGEASSPASGPERGAAPGAAEPVQAGKRVSPPGLGEKQRAQKDPSSPLSHTDDCVLGHGHLTVTTHSHLPPATQPPVTRSLFFPSGLF